MWQSEHVRRFGLGMLGLQEFLVFLVVLARVEQAALGRLLVQPERVEKVGVLVLGGERIFGMEAPDQRLVGIPLGPVVWPAL
jgi:hypothetical protein